MPAGAYKTAHICPEGKIETLRRKYRSSPYLPNTYPDLPVAISFLAYKPPFFQDALERKKAPTPSIFTKRKCLKFIKIESAVPVLTRF